MSRVDNAINEIVHIDELANDNQWINKIHPLVKFVITILFICMVISFDKYNMTGLVSMSVYPIVLFVICDFSFKGALYRLRFVLPVVCLVGICNPFLDREIVTYIGQLPVSSGVVSMCTLIIKGSLCVFASYILVITTSIEKLCYALRLIHIPRTIVTIVLLMYRYIYVLVDEMHTILQAYTLRAPGQKGISIRTWGSLVGQFMLRSIDRANEIYDSMCMLGYCGEYRCWQNERICVRDILWGIVWGAVIITLRVMPVFELVGSLVIR